MSAYREGRAAAKGYIKLRMYGSITPEPANPFDINSHDLSEVGKSRLWGFGYAQYIRDMQGTNLTHEEASAVLHAYQDYLRSDAAKAPYILDADLTSTAKATALCFYLGRGLDASCMPTVRRVGDRLYFVPRYMAKQTVSPDP